MERQKSFTFRHTRTIFISLAIPFPLLISFWAFTATLSPSSQPQLFPANVSPSLTANLSVPVPKDPIATESHDFDAANPPREDLPSSRRVQNGSFDDDHLSSNPTSSIDAIDLDWAKKNALRRSEVSTHGGMLSSPTTEEVISKLGSLISNGSLDNVHEKGTPCHISEGKWVYDENYPLYLSNACPYIDEGFSCVANGRTDREYMKWRWQPNNCNIPRFDPKNFLELIRGKRIVFVGDSINRNQWESMMCLLRGAISDSSRIHEVRGRRITKENGAYNFKFLDYYCSVEYYVTHFLVHESKARVGQKRVKTLRIDTMDRSSSRWKGADILVFNTAHWWSHYKTKAGVNYYQEGGEVHPHLDVSTAYRKALATWASWVDKNVNANKTRVFFRSSAPSHFSGGKWNSGGHCRERTQPLNHTLAQNTPEKNLIADGIISQMKTPVTLLNITSLSELRIDGHPSVYGRRPGVGPPSSVEDCSHWCLPGVPDIWNELLYFYLKHDLTAK